MKKVIFAAAAALLLVTGCKNEPAVVSVQSVTIAPDEIALTVGARQQLAATVLPENATAKEVVWSSSADDVAIVDQTGKVTATGAGLAIIQAVCGGKAGTCSVTVSLPIDVESVTVVPASLSLKPGEEADLTATILPADATDQQVVWSSSDNNVATVSESGHVVAVAEGQAVIKASCGGQEGECALSVSLMEAVDLGLPSGTLWAGKNLGAATAEAYGDYFAWGETAPKAWYAWSTYKWGTSALAISKYNVEDVRYALLPEDDAATASLGSEWRIPSVADWYELLDYCSWTWDETNSGYLVTSSSNGNSIFLPAPGLKPDDDDFPAGVYGGYWSIQRGYDEDSAYVIYYYNDGNDDPEADYWSDYRYYGYAIRAVKAPYIHPSAISIDDNSGTVKAGSTLQLNATIVPEDALEFGVKWSSSDASIAVVSATGLVTGVVEGTATITATSVDGGLTASQTITVTPPPAGVLYEQDFEGGLPSNWTLIDADEDGYNWYHLAVETVPAHNSSGLLTSASYYAGVLTPDNYAFTPAIALPADATSEVSAWLCAQDAGYPSEVFGIGISLVDPATLTASTVAANTTMLQNWTMIPVSGRPGTIKPRAQGNWYEYTVDLSAYAGQTVYVFFRHFNCTDWFRLNLDDVAVTTSATIAPTSAPASVKVKPVTGKHSAESIKAFRTRKSRK